ncbi:MAG TPA: hypothetical protein VF145_06435, partial [Chitinophagaceae bacterium]
MKQHSNVPELEPYPVRSEIRDWIDEVAAQCEPEQIYWVEGSQEEYESLCSLLVQKGTFRKLNPEKRPGSFACFSDPSDVARVEDRTFICSRRKEDAGPTNNWMAPEKMKRRLNDLLVRSMKGRTLYVIPFCMGPLGSKFARYGIQITDSEYVVVSMRIMTRIGKQVMPYL